MIRDEQKRKQYFKEYGQNNIKRFSLALNKEKDRDIIEAIESVGNGNIQQGVKLLIREALKNRDMV